MSRVLSAPRDSLSDGAEFAVWWVPRNVSAIITSILSDRHFSRALRKCGGRDFILCAASFTPACPLGRNINYRASSVAHVSRVTRRHRKHQRSTENSHDNHRFCPDDDPNYLGWRCSWLHLGEEPPPRLSLCLAYSPNSLIHYVAILVLTLIDYKGNWAQAYSKITTQKKERIKIKLT